MRSCTAILGLLCAGVLAVPAFGQDEDRFREISPGFGDVSPQMVDGLFRPVDFRAPVGFDRLYEIVGSGGLFARRSGAVTAVFDRSVYAWGSTAMVPPGTVYYIGDLPVDLARPGLFAPATRGEGARVSVPSMFRVPSEVADRRAETGAVPGRVDLRVGREAARGVPPVRQTGRSIWSSEEHRQRRVGELIRGAAWRWRASEAAEGR
ncbi:MAG: hypothetical protein Q9O74_02580 [Planctomycetota bacterium]|nr:hypothetical protein [Planctomycetota bacterium]